MGYYENDTFDVFIAYYGNRETGSETRAQEIYKRINNVRIGPNKYIRAYFHPAVNPYGSFEETPMIVARTPLFLLVVDKYIPTNSAGQLLKHRQDGTLSNLFEEVRSFHDSVMYKSVGGDMAAKVFIADDMDFKAAECLHPVFSGRLALRTHDEVLQWITHFYSGTYIDRLFRKYEYLAKERRGEFLQGAWVPEAEEVWRTMRSECIGRSLLIYYLYRSWQGDRNAEKQIRVLEREFSEFRNLDSKTLRVLDMVYRR